MGPLVILQLLGIVGLSLFGGRVEHVSFCLIYGRRRVSVRFFRNFLESWAELFYLLICVAVLIEFVKRQYLRRSGRIMGCFVLFSGGILWLVIFDQFLLQPNSMHCICVVDSNFFFF